MRGRRYRGREISDKRISDKRDTRDKRDKKIPGKREETNARKLSMQRDV